MTYAEENVQKFLDSQWESDAVKEVVAGLRKLSLKDKGDSVEGAVEIPAEVRLRLGRFPHSGRGHRY